jgi:hypothetical protein
MFIGAAKSKEPFKYKGLTIKYSFGQYKVTDFPYTNLKDTNLARLKSAINKTLNAGKPTSLTPTQKKKINDLEKGDIFPYPDKISAKYNDSNDLFKSRKSFVIDNKTYEIISVHSKPIDALKQSEKILMQTDRKPRLHYS